MWPKGIMNKGQIPTSVFFFLSSLELKLSIVSKNLIIKAAMPRPHRDVFSNFPLFGFRRYLR